MFPALCVSSKSCAEVRMSFGLLSYLSILGSLFFLSKSLFLLQTWSEALSSFNIFAFLSAQISTLSSYDLGFFLLLNITVSCSSSRTEGQLCLAFVLCASLKLLRWRTMLSVLCVGSRTTTYICGPLSSLRILYSIYSNSRRDEVCFFFWLSKIHTSRVNVLGPFLLSKLSFLSFQKEY